MTDIPKFDPERRAFKCKWYCDRWNNWMKRICNANCRKINITWDKSDNQFQYSINEKEKIKFILSRYEKYITPENLNNYLFINEINKEIENILNIKPKSQLDIFKEELY